MRPWLTVRASHTSEIKCLLSSILSHRTLLNKQNAKKHKSFGNVDAQRFFRRKNKNLVRQKQLKPLLKFSFCREKIPKNVFQKTGKEQQKRPKNARKMVKLSSTQSQWCHNRSALSNWQLNPRGQIRKHTHTHFFKSKMFSFRGENDNDKDTTATRSKVVTTSFWSHTGRQNLSSGAGAWSP